MMYLIIGIILLFFFLCTYVKECSRYRVLLYYLVAVVLVAFSTFRYEGIDYYGYVEIYDEVKSLLEMDFNNIVNTHGELGFLLINSFVKSFNGGIEYVFFAVSLICIYLLVKNACMYSGMPILSLVLYYNRFFIDRNLGQIRACIACMIIMYSIKFVKEKSAKKFFLSLLCACLFHKIAIIGLFVYFIDKQRITLQKLFVIVFIAGLIGFLIPLDATLQILIAYIGDFKFAGYLGDTEYFMRDLGVFYPVSVMQVTLLFYLSLYRGKLEGKFPYFNLMFNMYLFSTVWLLVMHKFGIYGARMATLYGTVEVMLMTYIPFVFKNRWSRYMSIFVILVISFGFMLLKISDKKAYPDYKSIIEFWF